MNNRKKTPGRRGANNYDSTGEWHKGKKALKELEWKTRQYHALSAKLLDIKGKRGFSHTRKKLADEQAEIKTWIKNNFPQTAHQKIANLTR